MMVRRVGSGRHRACEKEEDGEVNLLIRNGVDGRFQDSKKGKDGLVEKLMRNDSVLLCVVKQKKNI